MRTSTARNSRKQRSKNSGGSYKHPIWRPTSSPADGGTCPESFAIRSRILSCKFGGATATEAAPTSQTGPFKSSSFQEATVARAYASAVIEAPIEAVWSLIRNFNGLPGWVPRVVDSNIEAGLD